MRGEVRANLRLALPIVVTQVGTMAMGLIDTAFVGHVGERALAAVALGNTLSFACAMPGLGVFMAIEPITSQAVGAKSPGRAWSALREGVRLAVLLTPPTAVLTWASLALLPLLHVDPTVIPGARAYVLTRLPGILFLFLYMAGKTYQQATLRPRAAVEAVVLANVAHAAIAWFAVFRLGLGAAGAGVAWSVSSAIFAGWLLLIRAPPRPDGARTRGVDVVVLRKLLRVGVPIGLQLTAEVGVFSFVALLMGRIGGRAAAAHQIAIGLAGLSFMGALGVAQATSVRVGLAIGERAPGGARRAGTVGLILGVGTMVGWAVAFAAAPTLLARAFTSDPAVIAAAATLIRIAAIFQLADGTQVVAAGALRGAGDTRWPLLANLFAHWLIGLPLAWTLAFALGYGAPGLWYGLTGALVVVASALAARFFFLTRREPAPV